MVFMTFFNSWQFGRMVNLRVRKLSAQRVKPKNDCGVNLSEPEAIHMHRYTPDLACEAWMPSLRNFH